MPEPSCRFPHSGAAGHLPRHRQDAAAPVQKLAAGVVQALPMRDHKGSGEEFRRGVRLTGAGEVGAYVARHRSHRSPISPRFAESQRG
jgi:hypothetical protein